MMEGFLARATGTMKMGLYARVSTHDQQTLGFCRKVRFLGQNPKIGCQEFNDLQTPKLSKKQLCDRTRSGTSVSGIVARR